MFILLPTSGLKKLSMVPTIITAQIDKPAADAYYR